MTTGSTKAVHPSSSSNRARTNEMAADPSRMMTSWSLNCSRTSSHSGVGGSSGIAASSVRPHLDIVYSSIHIPFRPYFSRAVLTWACERPSRSETLKCFSTCSGERTYAPSIELSSWGNIVPFPLLSNLLEKMSRQLQPLMTSQASFPGFVYVAVATASLRIEAIWSSMLPPSS